MTIKNISKNSILVLFFLCAGPIILYGAEENIRTAAVDGTFYPSDPKELVQMIDGLVEKTPKKSVQGNIIGFILPHAGYVYSGQTAAYGYKLIKELRPDTVILIGPYHKALIKGASVWSSGAWKTPLGDVPIDEELAQALLTENNRFHFTKEAHGNEHSLEVQIPFLQRSLTQFRILPIAVNDPHPENTSQIARSIVKHLKDKKILIIASSDMSHYHPDKTAREMDDLTLELIRKKDVSGLLGGFESKKAELCGHAAVLTFIEISRLLENSKIEILNYSNSADTSGDGERVVGYGASVLYEPADNPGLTQEQGRKLLALARHALVHDIVGMTDSDLFIRDPALDKKGAVFVTLKKNGQLRGCIGNLEAAELLPLAVKHMALQAALHDPRFSPVTQDEVNDLKIEISVLSEPKRVQSVSEIKTGKHGVILKQGSRAGVFLPKVAAETGWSKEKFLEELCSQKAGLPPDCWKDSKTQLYVFSSQDFSETGP